MIVEKILEEFIHRFLGYGSFSASFWAVGMEEGGGSSFAEINTRLLVWEARGRADLEDLVDYHEQIGISRFFGKAPKVQSTWAKLIRVYFGYREVSFSDDLGRVLQFQACRLGRKEQKEVCLLELLPLPSPSTRKWLYSECSKLSFLQNRESYERAIIDHRIRLLQDSINEYNPEVVLFYGKRYLNHWKRIAGGDFDVGDSFYYLWRPSLPRPTIFICVNHPRAPIKGFTSSKWIEIGKTIRSLKQGLLKASNGAKSEIQSIR